MQGLHTKPGVRTDTIDSANAIWLLQALSSLFRTPLDTELAEREIGASLNPTAVAEAVGLLGLETTLADWPDKTGLQQLPLPAIVFLNAQTEAGGRHMSLLPAIIVQSDGAQLALLRPDRPDPQVLSLKALGQQAQPPLLLVSKTEPLQDPVADEEAGTQKEQAFGFSWFVPEILRHRSLWRDVLLASLSIQVVGLATPLFTQVIIDKVIAHHSQSTLMVLGVAMLVFMLFTSVMSWLRQYLIVHTGSRIDAVLGDKVLRHLFHLPMGYFEHRPTGTLVARLQGVETLREFVSGAAIGLLLDLPFLLLLLIVMFNYSLPLTLIALGIVSLILIVSLVMVPVFRQRLDRQFLLGARNQAFLTEHIAGMATVKSLQMEPGVQRRYGDYLAQYLSSSVATRQTANTYQVSASALEQTMTLSILVVGAWILMNNPGLTVGMLVAFQMFASRLSQPMMRLVGLWQEFQQASVAARRLADIMDMPTEPVSLAGHDTHSGAGGIELQQLGFRYSDHHPWLYRQLDLTLEPGQLTVLTGRSGCGKSTLAKLLLGFLLPEEGRILLDGRDTRNLAANELRAAYGVVPQETVLFSGAVHANLLMANPHASQAQLIDACRLAGIHETIELLPRGYQTTVGENGVGLSGGQRQRIAIARALLKQPRILIFDEATASLDQETAEQLATTINALKGKVTILFIAHRVPEALKVDRYVDLQKLGSE